MWLFNFRFIDIFFNKMCSFLYLWFSVVKDRFSVMEPKGHFSVFFSSLADQRKKVISKYFERQLGPIRLIKTWNLAEYAVSLTIFETVWRSGPLLFIYCQVCYYLLSFFRPFHSDNAFTQKKVLLLSLLGPGKLAKTVEKNWFTLFFSRFFPVQFRGANN